MYVELTVSEYLPCRPKVFKINHVPASTYEFGTIELNTNPDNIEYGHIISFLPKELTNEERKTLMEKYYLIDDELDQVIQKLELVFNLSCSACE